MKPTNIPAKGNANNSKYIYNTMIIQIRKCFSCNGMVSKSFSSDINKTTSYPPARNRETFTRRGTLYVEAREKQKQGIWGGFIRVSTVSACALPCPFSCPHASRMKLRLTRISTGLGERRCPGNALLFSFSPASLRHKEASAVG